MSVLLPFLSGVFFSNAFHAYMTAAPVPAIGFNVLLAVVALLFAAVALDAK